MSFVLHGIGASKGIAIGQVYVIHRQSLEVNEYCIPCQYVDAEITRFRAAIDIAYEQLLTIREHIPANANADIAAFIDTYMLMLNDSLLTETPINIIRERQCNAEWALKLHCDDLLRVFEEMDDPYLSTRRDDVAQIVSRLQRILRGYTDLPAELDTAHLKNTIVVADELTPADTALMQHRGVTAFVTEHGGTTSHTAILARSLGIPAIVGLRRVLPYVRQGDMLIVDGFNGTVIVNADEHSVRYYQTRQAEEKRYRVSLNKIKNAPAVTQDGTPVTLHANIEFPEDMTAVRRVGGKGIGLYRTEFLFLNRQSPPEEEEHYDAYVRVIRALNGGPVTIRTLDLGADKNLHTPWQSGRTQRPPSSDNNPALGLRAVRLCLRDMYLFRPQLRAAIRASALGRIRLMIPMVTGIQELLQVRHLVQGIQRELSDEDIDFDQAMPIGVMIETPAIAVCIDMFMEHADFFSIGTNDLIQYALAVDRVDDEVNYLYDPLHPAVLRLVKMSIDAAQRADKPLSMCGEMASDSRYVRLLLGLGLRAFSVSPEALLEVKQIINHSDIKNLSRLSRKLLKASHQSEVLELMDAINA